MIKYKADGVDFVPIFGGKTISSYTKEQWKSQSTYPRADRKYWKLNEKGKKEYLS